MPSHKTKRYLSDREYNRRTAECITAIESLSNCALEDIQKFAEDKMNLNHESDCVMVGFICSCLMNLLNLAPEIAGDTKAIEQVTTSIIAENQFALQRRLSREYGDNDADSTGRKFIHAR